MQITARSYLTAGVAALSVGAIAVTPVQPLPAQGALAQNRAVSNLAVDLAASIDPITPWVDTFKLAAENIKQLGAFYMTKPFPLLQTIGANLGTYAAELQNGNADLIPGQIQNNIKTFFYAPWWNRDGATIVNDTYSADYISNTQVARVAAAPLFRSQSGAYSLAAPLLAPQLGDIGPALVQFTATPYSGQLMGLISPLLSSVVQLTRSFTAVSDYFQAGDAIAAINELINIPANVTNASLNGGGVLDATSVVKPLLPPALAPLINFFGVNLSGWLSPPVPFNGSLVPNATPPDQFTGGTLFDSLAIQATGGQASGFPVGWGGSVVGLGQFLGQKMLVTPPSPPGTAAAITPAAAAAAPAVPAEPATPAVPATPADNGSPADPATPAEPATPAIPAVPDAGDTPAAADAAADTPAQGHRGGGNTKSDNGGSSNGRGHRGAN